MSWKRVENVKEFYSVEKKEMLKIPGNSVKMIPGNSVKMILTHFFFHRLPTI